MNRITTFFALAAALMFNTALQAQENAIKVNPLGALFGSLGVGFEHALNEQSSVQLNANFFSRSFDVSASDGSDTYNGTQKYSGFGISPEYRMYFDEVMRKWYGGAFINYNSLTAKTEYDGGSDDLDGKITISNFGGGIMFGHQWLAGSNENFVFDLNLGAGYQTASVDGDGDDDDDDIEFSLAGSGIWPKFSFAIGYAF